ncbi:MFS transporter [Streptomyces vinaceus]|uniref:MFS transporter n=1 Tax=Streptomyces vinaceus TaxID=1960 RepID=UPI00123E463A|nr:MFS transporter [Streptomyces vinaceus]
MLIAELMNALDASIVSTALPLIQQDSGASSAAMAACQLRGTEGDPRVTPDTDDCRPKCPNIAGTDRDIHQIRTRHQEVTVVTTGPWHP